MKNTLKREENERVQGVENVNVADEEVKKMSKSKAMRTLQRLRSGETVDEP